MTEAMARTTPLSPFCAVLQGSHNKHCKTLGESKGAFEIVHEEVVPAGHRCGNVEVLKDVDRIDGAKLLLLLIKVREWNT